MLLDAMSCCGEWKSLLILTEKAAQPKFGETTGRHFRGRVKRGDGYCALRLRTAAT